MIEICTVGGYDEVGRNMTAIKVDNEVVILDMGLHLQHYIDYTQDDDDADLSLNKLIEIKAVPDISVIEDWIPLTKAICISHMLRIIPQFLIRYLTVQIYTQASIVSGGTQWRNWASLKIHV